MSDHLYDNPALTPLEFLRAVYHDKSVDIGLRMKAAEAAMPYVALAPPGPRFEDLGPEDRLTIRIMGLGSNELSSAEEPRDSSPAGEVTMGA
jgi:hypothetical protein